MAFFQQSFSRNDKPFAHVLFFQLSDTSKELRDDFTALCIKYLSQHAGQLHFSLGYRALDLDSYPGVNTYDVSIDMIFENFADFKKYHTSEDQSLFITESAGMYLSCGVYESHVQTMIQARN